MVTQMTNDIILLIIALVLLNFFYPGVYLVIMMCVFYYLRSNVRLVLRAMNLVVGGVFEAKARWFSCYIRCLKHCVSMRQINKTGYMWKRFVEACHAIEPRSSMTGSGCGRWLGVRTSAVIAFLVFWTYLCPVIMVYWPLFKFKEHYWLVGLILTWSNRLADLLSNVTGRIPELMMLAEGGERLLELQNDCPVSLLAY